jgi:hypothetical protein
MSKTFLANFLQLLMKQTGKISDFMSISGRNNMLFVVSLYCLALKAVPHLMGVFLTVNEKILFRLSG